MIQHHNQHCIDRVKSKRYFFEHRQCKRLARLMAHIFDRLSYDECILRLQSYRRYKVEWLHDWEGSLDFFRRVLRMALRLRNDPDMRVARLITIAA